MSNHRATFVFSAGHFDLAAESFGLARELERDGRRVEFALPSRPDTFGDHIEALSVSTYRDGESTTAWEEGRVLVASVGAFAVSVDVVVDLSSTELNPDDDLDQIERGQQALDGAFPTALSVATEFLSWLRVSTGRYWLLPSHEAPEVHNGFLFETSSARRVRNISFNPVVHLYGFGREAGLTVEEIVRVWDLLVEGTAPGTPDLLLADAREALTGTSVEQDWQASRRDVRRAILLAAIASEVKIKTTLDDKTPPEKKALVDIILRSFREVEVAIGELPHKTMKAAFGRSLHEDNAELFVAVKKLFTDRNNVAHRGQPPSLEEARKDVDAAVKLFDWLDSLP